MLLKCYTETQEAGGGHVDEPSQSGWRRCGPDAVLTGELRPSAVTKQAEGYK